MNTSLPPGFSLQVPESPNDELSQSLSLIVDFDEVVRDGDVLALIRELGIEEASRVNPRNRPSVLTEFILCKNSLSEVIITSSSWRVGFRGFAFEYAEDNRLFRYAQGALMSIGQQEQTQQDKATDSELANNDSWYRIMGGVEVTFHQTSFPASYRTFTNGELRGCQVEWDEKGNVISDIGASPLLPCCPLSTGGGHC